MIIVVIVTKISTCKLLLSGAKSDEELKRYILDDSVRDIFWEEHEKLFPPAASFPAVPLSPAALPAGVTAFPPPLIAVLLCYSYIQYLYHKKHRFKFVCYFCYECFCRYYYSYCLSSCIFFKYIFYFFYLYSCAGFAAQAQTTIDLGPMGVISNIKPLAAVHYHSSMILYFFIVTILLLNFP